MIRARIKQFLILIIIVAGNISAQNITPFFVIHCEPKDYNLFPKLTQLINLADTKGIPLTIEFTPQWTEYIASDQFKLSLLKEWQKKGHEMGAHHHGIEVGTGWDGFTNHPQNEITFPNMYRGNMNDFISIINYIKGDSLITTAGIGDTVDLHPQLRFWTYGHTLDDAVSNPELFNILGNNYWRITYCFVGDTVTAKALINKYRNTFGNYLFGMVTHVFNFDDDEVYLRDLFEFFQNKNCRTVKQLMAERGIPVKVENEINNSFSSNYILYQNYPNPFNPTTTITYTIPTPPISLPLVRGGTEGGVVTLKVYDILGREVETLVNEYQPPGKYNVLFSVVTERRASLPNGVYFYRLQAGNFSSVCKMIYLK